MKITKKQLVKLIKEAKIKHFTQVTHSKEWIDSVTLLFNLNVDLSSLFDYDGDAKAEIKKIYDIQKSLNQAKKTINSMEQEIQTYLIDRINLLKGKKGVI